VEAVRTAVGNNFLKEVGQGVYHTTVRSAEVVGSLADSAVTMVHGIATDDGEKVKEGILKAGRVVKTTATGLGWTFAHTATNASQVVKGVLNDDLETAGRDARELAKTVVISSLSIGFCDMVFDVSDVVDEPLIVVKMLGDTVVAASEIDEDIAGSEIVNDTVIAADGMLGEITDVSLPNNALEREPDVYWVEPHWVNSYQTADGTYVDGYWRDGDGDTSVNLGTHQGGGYLRSSPIV